MHFRSRKQLSAESGMEALVGRFLLLFLRVARLSPLYVAVNIWPKLLQLISKGVEAHLRSPARKTRRPTAIGCGVINRGNSDRGCVAGKLRNVEHVRPGVSSSNENTVDGIAETVHERAP